jgi:hypothetical protein
VSFIGIASSGLGVEAERLTIGLGVGKFYSAGDSNVAHNETSLIKITFYLMAWILHNFL